MVDADLIGLNSFWLSSIAPEMSGSSEWHLEIMRYFRFVIIVLKYNVYFTQDTQKSFIRKMLSNTFKNKTYNKFDPISVATVCHGNTSGSSILMEDTGS